VAEEVRFDIVSIAHSRGLKDADRDLRGLSAGADKTGKSFHRAAGETFNLDRAIAEARVEIQRLNEEFKRTGDDTLFRSMRRQRAELNQLLKVAGEGAKPPALDFGGAGIRPHNALIGGVVGAVAALAPLLGAMISGAVTGAVGLGGIAGGIAAAAHDQRVKSAARQFGSNIASEFFSGGASFVQPVIDSLDILEDAFHDMDLGSSFARLAPHVTTLAHGLGNMATNIMPGLNIAFDRMGPFIDVLAEGLGEMGTQLGDLFNRASRSRGALMGLESVFHLINGTLIIVGTTLEFLSDAYENFVGVVVRTSGALEDLPFLNPALRAAMREVNDMFGIMGNQTQIVAINTDNAARAAKGLPAASDAWAAYAGQVKIAADHQEDLNRAMEESISNMLAQDNANLGLQQAMADFGETLKENGKHWDTNTQKGRDNRRGLLDSVEAAERKRQADIKMGIQMGLSAEEAAAKANAAYNKTIAKLKEMATKAGISEAALKDLVGDYYVNVHYRQSGSAFQHSAKILEAKGRALGGPVGAGTYVVGERGPEVLELGQGSRGHVYPSIGAYGGGRGSRGSMGGGNARPLVIQTSDALVRVVLNMIAQEVGRRGGTLAVLGVKS
jgi:hypothetical protein